MTSQEELPALYTVKHGENAGRQYYAIRNQDGSFKYFRWVAAKIQNMDEALAKIESIKKEVDMIHRMFLEKVAPQIAPQNDNQS
jgi:protein-tyrosine phosphatase